MKSVWYKFIYILLIHMVMPFLTVYAQVISNQGTSFALSFPTHVPDFDAQFNPLPAQISIFITGSQASSGKVSCGSFLQVFKVAANMVTEVKVPRSAAYINDTESGQVLPNRAIQITVDDGKPKVAVYAHIFAGQRSAASLILPAKSLGKQYYSMNFQQHDTEGQNYITLVATEPNTTIHIKKGNIELVPGGIKLVNVNDVYEYLSSQDLSGVSVSIDPAESACKHFAMFSGSTGVYIAPSSCTPHSLDPLFQQCYAVENWGKVYGFIPFSTYSPKFSNKVRTAGQFVRVIAKDAGTVVSIDGTIVATLGAGEYYTTPAPLTTAASISASKPVSVAQFALSQACGGNGYSDPDMVFLNPIDHSINDITVYSSTRENISEQYLNILIPTSAASGFRINKQLPAEPFTTMAKLPGYSYLQLNLNKYATSTFRLTAKEGFNAIAYGFGNVESYAYSAGTNLNANVSFNAIQSATKDHIDSACVNNDYYFQLILPYKPTRISWKMDNNETPVIQNNPTARLTDIFGSPAYVYELPKTVAYEHPGIHLIEVKADYTGSPNTCDLGVQQVIQGNFKVLPLPLVKFKVLKEDCGFNVHFNDISDTAHIVSRLWNFDDPNSNKNDTSSAINPTHLYADTGTYHVTLTLTSAAGCQALLKDTLYLYRKGKPEFYTSEPACEGKPLFFTDNSNIAGFTTALRKWYYGDGSIIESTALTTKHIYKNPGKYAVKLLLVDDQGCISDTITKEIIINARPIPDFITPDICLTDGYAKFTDQSVLPDDKPGYTYLWNFDDQAHSTFDNPNVSTLKDPVHLFKEAKTYNISFTITSPAGCDTTIKKALVVNGTQPKASFEIMASGAVCSGQPIYLKNNSSVLDFGSITRMVWRFDDGKNKADTLSISHPEQNKTYSFSYPPFNRLPETIQHTIKLIVYSGHNCVDSLSQTITTLPVPLLQFNELGDMCTNSAPVQLTQAREVSGLSNSQTWYTGPGISSAGMLDPKAAGAGIHTIVYHFTTTAQCTDSVSRTINVIEEPFVNGGPDVYVLQGDKVILKPAYKGENLNYKWIPATGLDNIESPNPLANPTVNTDYTVTVNSGICSNSATIHVKVLNPPEVFNTFTPNGDGTNDVWSIPHLQDYPHASVTIFNRYGTQLYASTGYYKPWNGKYNDIDVPAGTYYYIIKPGNGQKNYSGFLTVIR